MVDKATGVSRSPGDNHLGPVAPAPSSLPPLADTKEDLELQEPTTSSTDADQSSITEQEANTTRPSAIQRITSLMIWTPKRLRYDPDNPPAFGYWLNSLYAIVCGFNPHGQFPTDIDSPPLLLWPTCITTSPF
jgi:hypothetical protein